MCVVYVITCMSYCVSSGFPALVLTVKTMQVSVNLSKRLASAGKFSGFCIRFDEQFHFRHKTWTVDPKKHKFLNYGMNV